MFQFRWRPVTIDEPNAVKVDGIWCALEYRELFMPRKIASGDIVLAVARDVDAQWKPVVIAIEQGVNDG